MDQESPSYIDIDEDIHVKQEGKPTITEFTGDPGAPLYLGLPPTPSDTDLAALKAQDCPEYLAYNIEGHALMNSEELTMESKWIARKVIAWKKIKNHKIIGNDLNWINSINEILKEMFVYKKEVMYIWNYERQILNGDVNLSVDDLWFIVEMDTKWLKAKDTKEKIKAIEGQVLSEGHEFSPFLDSINTSREIFDYFECMVYEGLKNHSVDDIELAIDKEDLSEWLLRKLNSEKIENYYERVRMAGKKRNQRTSKNSNPADEQISIEWFLKNL
jgi:hypothetical protein